MQLSNKAALAVEFNIFPYAQNTGRQVHFIYQVGGMHFRYNDTSVFNKLWETRPYNRLSAITEFNSSWGTINLLHMAIFTWINLRSTMPVQGLL